MKPWTVYDDDTRKKSFTLFYKGFEDLKSAIEFFRSQKQAGKVFIPKHPCPDEIEDDFMDDEPIYFLVLDRDGAESGPCIDR